jgi:alkanesulfonate monooxygenase SsuD/methylene tetrahydromethanopterin reductase-like flavin-dependent oxidoreductase (luciferase family)
MQFGWLTLSLSPEPAEDAQRIDQLIEQACLAERLGFSDIWLTEHYFTGESVYNDSLMFGSRRSSTRAASTRCTSRQSGRGRCSSPVRPCGAA